MEHNITLERAVSLLSESLAPLGREAVSVSRALGRVLAENLRAERDFPPTSCAEVAGYAVRSADLSGAKASRPICLTLRAGVSISSGEAVAVGAGQPLPTGCDSVLPLVDARAENGEIAALRALWPYDHFIRRGEHCPAGTVLLPAGTLLSPVALALLTEAGYGEVSVLRHPKAALFICRKYPRMGGPAPGKAGAGRRGDDGGGRRPDPLPRRLWSSRT